MQCNCILGLTPLLHYSLNDYNLLQKVFCEYVELRSYTASRVSAEIPSPR